MHVQFNGQPAIVTDNPAAWEISVDGTPVAIDHVTILNGQINVTLQENLPGFPVRVKILADPGISFATAGAAAVPQDFLSTDQANNWLQTGAAEDGHTNVNVLETGSMFGASVDASKWQLEIDGVPQVGFDVTINDEFEILIDALPNPLVGGQTVTVRVTDPAAITYDGGLPLFTPYEIEFPVALTP